MVKKISGSTPTRPTDSTSGVKSTGVTQTNKVGQVGTVNSKSGIGRARQSTRPLTAEERAHLMSLVDEEADKLFGEHGISDSRRAVVTGSVKMTLQAGLLGEDEDDEDKKS